MNQRREDNLKQLLLNLPFALYLYGVIAATFAMFVLSIKWLLECIPILIVWVMILPGCNSFGLTPGYREKHPDLLENVRHFYSEPLWTRKIHCHHQRRH